MTTDARRRRLQFRMAPSNLPIRAAIDRRSAARTQPPSLRPTPMRMLPGLTRGCGKCCIRRTRRTPELDTGDTGRATFGVRIGETRKAEQTLPGIYHLRLSG